MRGAETRAGRETWGHAPVFGTEPLDMMIKMALERECLTR